MALTFSCPSCKSVLRVSETMAGKKARCPSCQTVFTLPQLSETEAPAPITASPPPAPAAPPIEEPPPAPKVPPPISLTPDDDEDDAPRAKKPPPLSEKPSRRRSRDDDDEEDDDEDDRPRRRRRPLDDDDEDDKDDDRPRRRRRPLDDDDEDDEDDEDDDRPRRRRRKPASSNTGLWVLGGIGAVVVLLLVCGGGMLILRNMGGGSKIALVNGAVTINDSLGITDSFDAKRRNCRCRRYQIDMVQGRTYVIDQMSGAIDSYLRLEDPTGAQVAEDDDGGAIMGGGMVNLNARIIYVAPRTGTYTIIATSFDARLGPFTLTVRETAPGGLPVKK